MKLDRHVSTKSGQSNTTTVVLNQIGLSDRFYKFSLYYQLSMTCFLSPAQPSALLYLPGQESSRVAVRSAIAGNHQLGGQGSIGTQPIQSGRCRAT